MEFERTGNQVWLSTCGAYRIACTGRHPHFIYSASYKHPDGSYQQLGIFERAASEVNAEKAKQACIDHQVGRAEA